GRASGLDVHVVGEVFPDAGHALHLGLTAEVALSADLAGYTGDFVGEGVELVDHSVDGLLELEDLAADVDGDLPGQVALLDRGGDLGDVADLAREVAGHEVHVVGEVFPDPGHAPDVRLPAELALGADLARYAGDLVRAFPARRSSGLDGLLELEDLAADVDGDLP